MHEQRSGGVYSLRRAPGTRSQWGSRSARPPDAPAAPEARAGQGGGIMAVTVRVRIYPAVDKVGEVRQFMTEWVKSAQGQGENLALAQRIYSSEGPVLIVAASVRRPGRCRRSPPREPGERRVAGATRDVERHAARADSSDDRGVAASRSGRSDRHLSVAFGASSSSPPRTRSGELRSEAHGVRPGTAGRGAYWHRPRSADLQRERADRSSSTTVHADIAALDQLRRDRAAEAAGPRRLRRRPRCGRRSPSASWSRSSHSRANVAPPLRLLPPVGRGGRAA